LNLRIIWSEFNEFKTVGPYELDWETQQYKCDISFWISTGLLTALQALNLFWLFYILRIAYRFLFSDVLEDDRSDNEENELAEEQKLDALSSQGIDKEAGTKMLANGSLNGKTSSADMHTNKMTNRREGKKKS
jgi:acyl-CoA-dependent ceramide synthase